MRLSLITKIFIFVSLLFLSSCFVVRKTANVVRQFSPLSDEHQLQTTNVMPQKYVDGIADLALYPGFIQIQDENLSYDTAKGRVVERKYISTDTDANLVRKYYSAILPKLGWVEKEYQEYVRDNETLKLNILQDKKDSILKFILIGS